MKSIEYYGNLRFVAKAERNWSAAHLAYHRVVTAFQSDNPLQSLADAIANAHETVADLDQKTWNSRNGYRAYYKEQIEIYQKVMKELKGEEQ